MADHDSTRDVAMDARLRREGEASRRARAGCPSPDLLAARRSEVLDEAMRRRLETHLATCDACQRFVADVESLGLAEPDEDIARRVAARIGIPASRGRLGPWSVAAALLLASGVGVTWWASRPSQPAPAASAPVSPVASGPPSGETGAAVVPAGQVALWSISAPPLRLPLSSLDPARGSETDADAPSFADAVGPYQAGDYQRAGERLAQIARTTPSSGDAQFYLGVSRLLAGHPHDAIPPLNKARTLMPATRHREVDWYLAAALQRAGDHEAARERLEALCQRDGAFRQEACAAQALLQ